MGYKIDKNHYHTNLKLKLGVVLKAVNFKNINDIGLELQKISESITPNGIFWLYNYNTSECYYSDAFIASLNYDREEVDNTTKFFYKTANTALLNKGFEMIEELIKNKSEECFYNNIAYKTKEGKEISIICIGTVLYKNGFPDIVLGTHEIVPLNQNILEYQEQIAKTKFFADKLDEFDFRKDSKEIYEALKVVADYDVHPRLIWDNKGIIIYANNTFLNGLGYLKEDLIGEGFFEEDGSSKFITKDYLEDSKKQVIENVSKESIAMKENYYNEWYNKEGNKVGMLWKKGFNDPKTKFGTCQVSINNNETI